MPIHSHTKINPQQKKKNNAIFLFPFSVFFISGQSDCHSSILNAAIYYSLHTPTPSMLPQTSHTSRKCGKSPQALYQRTKIVLRYKHVTQKQCVCRCVFGWMCFYICMCVCAFIGAYCPSGYNETLKISVLRAPSSVMSKMCHSATYSTSQAPTQQSILTPLTALCPKLSVCNQHY